MRRINLGGRDVGLALQTSPEVVQLDVENSGPAFTLRFRPALAPGTRVERAESSDGARPRVGAQSGGAYEVELLCPAGRTTRVTLHLAG